MKHLTLLFLLASFTFYGQTESIFWKVEHPELKEASYLFGTYHLIKDSFLDQDAKKVKKAYKKSSTVVIESLLDNEESTQKATAYMFSDSSLQNNLSESDYILMDSIFSLRTGQNLELYDNMEPLIISLFIGISYHQDYLAKHDNYTGEFLDQYFEVNGKENMKSVFGLESIDESFSYSIDSVPYEDQINMMVSAATHDTAMSGIAGRMYESYIVNDPEGIISATDYYNSLTHEDENDFITIGRNLLWMPRLEEHLQKGNVFVAVGFLHLTGDQGLVNLIREQGYTLTPLKLK